MVLGPIVVKKIRTPINKVVYARKESEIAQLEIETKKIERKIAPDKKAIRDNNKKIDALTKDLEENTEERETKVRERFHFNTSEVRVLDAETGKELERRTMTAEERSRTTDVEDEVVEPAADTEANDVGDGVPADAE